MLSQYSRRFISVILLLFAGFFLSASQVDAALQLKLEPTPGTSVTVSDNGPGDSDPAVGAITYSAPIGNFIVHTTAGLSKPIVGIPPDKAELDLSVVTVAGASGGTLKISLTDTDFFLTPYTGNAILTSAIGGTTPGQTWYQSYVDRNNNPFGTGDITSGPQGPFTGAFGGPATTATKVYDQVGDFSMTVVAVATIGPNQTQSFGASTTVVPPPCTGQIGDFAWKDLNLNGCQDDPNSGFEGVTVILYEGTCGQNGDYLTETVTDANGYYHFTNLCAGEYQVVFVTPAGYIQTTPTRCVMVIPL